MSLLTDFTWRTKYDADGRALVDAFFIPALSSATRYHRTTGYFSAGVLMLASRGIEGLVRNDGRMRLVVGCTLGQDEVAAVERGEELRHLVEVRLGSIPLEPTGDDERQALELLSWMVARGFLEMRVAVPCDEHRRPVAGQTLFHEKAGVVEDKAGHRVAFNGSVNETAQGWVGNWESFHVFTDWRDPSDRARVEAEEESFQRLWLNEARRCVVVDIPAAVRDGLLQFLPPEGQLPEKLRDVATDGPDSVESPAETRVSTAPVSRVDLRPVVWGTIAQAPTWPSGGERVGEATSIVTPWPHQIRAFNRLYENWPPRLLIADEVGLGKTIEAGLLLRQAWLAGKAKRILILAPKAVLTQWQIELREKFNLNWPIYDGTAFHWYKSRAMAGRTTRRVRPEDWHREPFVIASSQLMRRAARVPELATHAEPWDLVILDEAHHARRKGAGLTADRKPNQLLGLMQKLKTRTQGLVLMTATPMQVSPVEVWDLLDLLGLPEGWDELSFLDFFAKAAHPNPSTADFEFLAEKFRRAEAHFGEVNLDYARRFFPGNGSLATKRTLQALRDSAHTERRRLETDRRKAAIRVMQSATPVARLISRHTRELLREYFRAGKISTRIADRIVDDVLVPMSEAERAVYEAVEDYISTVYAATTSDRRNAVGFVMTVYRKRVASSFAALRETLKGRLQDISQPSLTAVSEEDVSDDDAGDDAMDSDDVAAYAVAAAVFEAKAGINTILEMVKRLPADTKATHLMTVLEELRKQGYQQALVFTQFTDTLDFLREHVAAGERSVMCFSGRGGEIRERSGLWRTVSRDEVKRIFRSGGADVLLCTDAAAEGLNFQFCGALVNYDMPWNPMRVEQRIGRIDRLGQRFKDIKIVNLHYEDTVETDVYQALRLRIGLFSQFVGKLQPILASLPRQLAEISLLAPKDRRERQRTDLVGRLDSDVRSAQQQAFDLDVAVAADLDEPERPEPYVDLASLDLVIRRPDLLPPGVSVEPLATREYSYSAPGMAQAVRVTTDPSYFDQHATSVELWSPGSPLFPTPEVPAAVPPRRLRDVVEDAS